MTPQEAAIDRSVLANDIRVLADAIDKEVELFGDTTEGAEAWNLSAAALTPPGTVYEYAGWKNSDFAHLARVFAFLLDTTSMELEDAFDAAVDQVDGEDDEDDEAGIERAVLMQELVEGVIEWIDAGAPNKEEIVPAFEEMSKQFLVNLGMSDEEYNDRATVMIDDMLDQFAGAIINKQEGDEVDADRLVEALKTIDEVEEAVEEFMSQLKLDDDEPTNEELEGVELDISDEESRVYTFATENGGTVEVEVEAPKTLFICDDGTHYITDITGVLEIVSPGYLKVKVYPLPDHDNAGA